MNYEVVHFKCEVISFRFSHRLFHNSNRETKNSRVLGADLLFDYSEKLFLENIEFYKKIFFCKSRKNIFLIGWYKAIGKILWFLRKNIFPIGLVDCMQF